ncbi:MAG: HD domain-containing phosphohydrolase [Bacteroidota bacterium]
MENKGKLLIVDDETAFLKILSIMFSKFYDVRTAESGEEALKILKDGFKAEVILSDQRMPGMSGAEFLEKSMSIVPDATRVILTGYTTPKDIIPAINQAHAYMYLIKPADELSLVQSIKIAFDNYNKNKKVKKQAVELKKTIEQLKEKNEELQRSISENTELLNQTIQAISGIASYAERFYFTNHTKFVAITAKLFAEELGLSKDRINNIVLASLLHSSVLNGMPINYILTDPHDLTDDKKMEYLKYFRTSLDTILKVKKLKKYADIIANIWEHHDGSGFPAMLSGTSISYESQIIALVNFYHNNVYRMQLHEVPHFFEIGYVLQGPDRTKKRHEEAIKSLYRHATWFDYDLFHHFQDIIRKKSIPTLVPEQGELRIVNIDVYVAGLIQPKVKSSEETNEEAEEPIEAIETSQGQKMREMNVFVSQLEPGMMMGQTLFTKNGMLVVKNETILDEATIKNIKQLESTEMIPSKVTILVPL